MKKFKHQQKILDDNPSKALLALDTGLGKSMLSLWLAEKRQEPTMIICPKALQENWGREIDQAGTGLKTFVITKETFKRDWDTLPFYPTVIVDEAHFFAGRTSQMAKALYKYFKKWNVPNRYLLTATPYLSTPWNIYTLARMLDYDPGYKRFEAEFFTKVWMGQRQIPVVKPNKDQELKAIINKIGYTVLMEDCFDVPEQKHLVEEFELTDEQKGGIDDIVDPEHIVYWTIRS